MFQEKGRVQFFTWFPSSTQRRRLRGRNGHRSYFVLPSPREGCRRSWDTPVSQKLLLPADFKIIRVQLKGISFWTLLCGFLGVCGPVQLVAVLASFHPLLPLILPSCPERKWDVPMCLFELLSSLEKKVNSPRMSVTDFTILLIMKTHIIYCLLLILPSDSERRLEVPPSLSKLLLVPLVNGDENSHAQSRVCRAILELSLHLFCLCLWPCLSLSSSTGLWCFQVFGEHCHVCEGVTLTVNAFVLEQGLHCVSLGENKIPETQSSLPEKAPMLSQPTDSRANQNQMWVLSLKYIAGHRFIFWEHL